ncbi:MAG: Ldh family oxidoreductase [Burkholderiaceae bacterium]|nr:Ldh family oxidoreductase [Burkholderiaceae bacterium]
MEKNISYSDLIEICAAVFRAVGVPSDVAEVVAENLAYGDLRGVSSHGVVRVPIYVRRVEEGVIDPNSQIVVEKESGSTLLVDGSNNFGAYVGISALRLGIKKAKDQGVCAIGIKGSNHYGLGAYYAAEAIKHGCLLIAASNAPQTMAPVGGVRPFLGTNPLTIGVPTKNGAPFMLDMATSVVARGRMMVAEKQGTQIPNDWAIDTEGNPTSDPTLALQGSLLPLGGFKGFGLAMALDILSGVLTGAGYGPSVNSLYEDFSKSQNVGHFFIVVDISKFIDINEFQDRMQHYIDLLKKEPVHQDTTELFYAGELEHKKEQNSRKEGIVIPSQIRESLMALAQKYEIDVDVLN